jgi:double-strand break repair protein MRE11
MVLLAGDLFHDNKPSRRTLHKTMEILRRYCMGPNPVQFQIVSDQAANFRSVHGTVNYEDSYYSVVTYANESLLLKRLVGCIVLLDIQSIYLFSYTHSSLLYFAPFFIFAKDLPIFSIHGNHDDPTRDGGTEMLAALDLLSVSNLVNYFGRHDEVDKVEVSPILIRKGSTRVALYGMGSMRDERLNRMWQGKKVRFLRPEVDAEDDDEEENAFFNIFALHQNRDLGRGSKNCVHESMIPEWMDLVSPTRSFVLARTCTDR